MVSNIIFDLGGVLIDWNPRYVYRHIFDDEKKMEWFLTEICSSDWNEQQDAGRTLAEGTQLLQDQFPEWKQEIAAFYGRWEEMLGGAIDPTVDILKEIHDNNRHNLYALTNWSNETFPVALERYDFLQIFEGIVVSGKEMCKKPDQRIYRILLDRFGLKPNESLFIDDNKRNVQAALQLGIQALWFDTPEKLRLDLKEMHIL